MAGASSSENGLVPNLARIASQPATTPGTVTEWMPFCGILVIPLAARNSTVRPDGAQPLEFKPWTVPVFAS